MEKRKRIFGPFYELARIKVPPTVADFIESKRKEMRECKCWDLYSELKKQCEFQSKTYEESKRLSYLKDLFWVLSGKTPVYVKRLCRVDDVPTNELERKDDSFGYDKVQPCVVLSLRVRLNNYQCEQVKRMIAIVEEFMTSFETDFYLHDMLRFSRYLCKKPILWIVGNSHTFSEILDAEREADRWMLVGSDVVRRFINGDDDTSMGCVLRTSWTKNDRCFYHDGSVLHEVSRERFKTIHDRHVERLRELLREKIENLSKAA